jgi:hypothetical protein
MSDVIESSSETRALHALVFGEHRYGGMDETGALGTQIEEPLTPSRDPRGERLSLSYGLSHLFEGVAAIWDLTGGVESFTKQWHDLSVRSPNTWKIIKEFATRASVPSPFHALTGIEGDVLYVTASVSAGTALMMSFDTEQSEVRQREEKSPQLEAVKLHCWLFLSRTASNLRRGVAESLRRQVSRLFNASEWDPEDRVPSVKSFQSLVAFLSRHSGLRAPSLTISSDGNFVASFLRGRDNIVRLEFDAEGWVRWLTYVAPPWGTSRPQRAAGYEPADKVRSHLTYVWEWISE